VNTAHENGIGVPSAKDVPTKSWSSRLWLALNLILGLIGGITLAWGPLAAPWPIVALLGLTGGLLGGLVGWWSASVRRRSRGVLLGHGVILLVVAAAALIPVYRIGMIAMPGETWEGNFRRLWRAMDYAYPYFEQKGVDWDDVYRRYAPQMAQVESDHAYWRLVTRMLAELNDGHTGLISPSPRSGRRYFAICRDVGGVIVLDQVGQTALDAGLERGNVVLAVEDVPIEEALERVSPVLRAGSTPWQRRANAAYHLLSTTEDPLAVTVSGVTGERTVVLVWPDDPLDPAAEDVMPWQPLITGERLPSGVGLIHIPTFGAGSGHDLVAEFDAALDGLMDAPGLILDLRENGGGSTSISDRVAGRFFAYPFIYGREYFYLRLLQRGWRPWFDYRVVPRGSTYDGPVVLLTDVYTFSTAENFCVAMVDSGRATTVGRQTAGSSGNPVPFRLPGGARARFSTGDFRRNDGGLGMGQPIEGVGIAPDVLVIWTVDDLREGRDPDVAAAEHLLLGR
jgi:carboxyl-terminal processing protease